jgi:hypothetical protein
MTRFIHRFGVSYRNIRTRDSGTRNMERPTIWSSRPDPMRRTVCVSDEHSRRARYGRIQPMETRKSLFSRIARLLPYA